MKVIVSVGGSVLAPDLEADRVEAYASALEGLETDGHTLGTVVGGGPTARDYIGTARELGANEIELDQLGISVTRLNARLLIAALGERAAPTPPTNLESAREAMRRGDLPVMGGTAPAHTTDAVGASLAEYVNADLLVLATSVDGVYDADPSSVEGAAKFDSLSVSELVDVVADIEMNAGSNAPVDLLAAKVVQRAGLRAVVVDGTDPENVVTAIEGGHDGTEILPETDA
ncbi:UMP kinase [Haloarculaceae archaeon H-GB2-1]|nr:UMP kinase [Haloarculaceae archaeon H-GB1-1]MEA5385690.1 UMP kinase [Haloarculaceae archaeon H-GB11]MEA5407191.1 UMP kinase [Haloarculaceae archaeon H-GB2-1]